MTSSPQDVSQEGLLTFRGVPIVADWPDDSCGLRPEELDASTPTTAEPGSTPSSVDKDTAQLAFSPQELADQVHKMQAQIDSMQENITMSLKKASSPTPSPLPGSSPDSASISVDGESDSSAVLRENIASELRESCTRRMDNEQVQPTIAPDVMPLTSLNDAMLDSEKISIGDKVALWSKHLEQSTVVEVGDRDGKVAAVEQGVANVSAESGGAGVGSDAIAATSDALEALIEMEHALVAERRLRAEMTERFEKLLQEVSSKHAGSVSTLELELAQEKQRNAQFVEMKRESDASHSRDIAVLEGMVQRTMEENERLSCEVKAWKAAAKTRRTGSSNASTTSSTSISSGGDRRSISPSISSGDVSSPELAVLMPAAMAEDVSMFDGSGSESAASFARMSARMEAVPRI